MSSADKKQGGEQAPQPLVLPSEIPWQDLRGKDLEECVYWLLDSMGAKDLDWRIGGEGGGAADQGRDLECFFYMPGPDNELQRQRWWVEVKGRGQTLEPTAVKEAATNALGRRDVDVLVVATNTTFSNPTRDWVREFQASHRHPSIRLWDKTVLEKLVGQHPDVVIRLFSDALSPAGKLEVARSRFWNHSGYAGRPHLRLFWSNRADLEWTEQSIIAVLVGEVANGDVSRRPWAMLWAPVELLSILAHALGNVLFFCLRAERAGIEQGPYIKAVAYLTLAAIHQTSATAVGELFRRLWDSRLEPEVAARLREFALEPVLNQLGAELRDVCIDDCERVSTDPIELTGNERERYWRRLIPVAESTIPADDEDVRSGHVVIEQHAAPCRVGFALNREVRCPIVSLNVSTRDVQAFLHTIERIVQQRGPERPGKHDSATSVGDEPGGHHLTSPPK